MAYNANILLGRITKVHGFEGAVTVKLEKTFIESIPDMESVFLEIEWRPVPFFIEESEYPGGDILRLKFIGYDTFDKVNEFAGCRVFLTAGEKEKSGTNIRTLYNYKVFIHDNTLVGIIKEVIENPGQWLLKISTSGGKEILIPFHEDFIIDIDNRKKIIKMDLPEGLTDIK
jgi:16S rRNA processing protein RimM